MSTFLTFSSILWYHFCILLHCPKALYNLYLAIELSLDHFGLHQEKIVKVTMECEVPKRRILRPTLSNDKVQQILQWKMRSGKKNSGTHGKEIFYSKTLMIFFEKRR